MARDRETISQQGVKSYIRRDDRGRFTSDQVNVGKSLTKDRQQHSKTVSKKGQGDKGDRQSK